MRACLLLIMISVGCSNSGVGGGGDDEHTDIFSGPCSVDNVTGTLPGVSITILSDSCVFHQGQAATFTYRITTTANVPAIDVPGSNSCDCEHRSTQIDSWTRWVIAGTSMTGNTQQYCLCDTGCCAPQGAQTITPDIGTFEGDIAWSGRTWQGPSDTGNPEGGYFALGNYGVTVGFTGYAQGSVEATLPIEIVP